MNQLTARQREIYDYLRTSNPIPSMREVAAHFGIASTQGVKCHLEALERKGFVRRPSSNARSMWVLGRVVVDLDIVETGTEIDIDGRTFTLVLKEESDAGTHTEA